MPNMKSAIYILLTLIFVGCAEKQIPNASLKISVFSSILPQTGIAKSIAGNFAEVHTLIGEGQSPHAYEPTAKQLALLGEADVLFTIGMPFEKHLLKKIIPLYPNLLICETESHIKLRSMSHKHHEAKDPHVWLSPANSTAIAFAISQALEKIDPAHADEYRKNYKKLADELSQLDDEIRTMLAPYSGKRFYVFHPSFGYFSDTYGLEQIPIELDGKSPSPRQLIYLIEKAKADGVKVIFVQKQFPVDSAKAISDAIDGIVVPLNPLAEDSVANLRLIAESITHALKK